MITFAKSYGRYRWLRMPKGISPKPDQKHFRERSGETLERANQDHDNKLRALLNRCREKSIKLNAEKVKLRRSKVPYIGHILPAEGSE